MGLIEELRRELESSIEVLGRRREAGEKNREVRAARRLLAVELDRLDRLGADGAVTKSPGLGGKRARTPVSTG